MTVPAGMVGCKTPAPAVEGLDPSQGEPDGTVGDMTGRLGRRLAIVVLAGFLVACGGGGSREPADDPVLRAGAQVAVSKG